MFVLPVCVVLFSAFPGTPDAGTPDAETPDAGATPIWDCHLAGTVLQRTAPGLRVAHGQETHASPLAAASDAAPGRVVALALLPDAAAPVIRLAPGEVVRLVLSGLPSGPVHLHGYDIEASADPEGRAVIEFEAVHTGRFPMMVHREDPLLGPREAAALYIEIAAP